MLLHSRSGTFYESVPGDSFLEEQVGVISLGALAHRAGVIVTSFGTQVVRFGAPAVLALGLLTAPMSAGVMKAPWLGRMATNDASFVRDVEDVDRLEPDRFLADGDTRSLVRYLQSAPRIDVWEHLVLEDID